MKRMMMAIAAMVMSWCVMADTWTDPETGIEWTYTVSDGKASVGGGSWNSPAVPTSTTGAITIPSTIDGYPVTSIGNYAFRSCSGLMSVTITEGVTSIGNYAFRSCSGLMSVTITEGVTSIGSYAFDGCSGLTSVTIPSSVTSIGDWAFCGCSRLTSVTITEGVASIGEHAFYDCSGLTDVKILSSEISIDYTAFQNCKKIVNATVPGWDCWIDFASGANVIIADGTTNIRSYGFPGRKGIESVTIPSSVTNIGSSAFGDCSGLTSVTIPEGVTSIGADAFCGCTGLMSVSIPSTMASIGEMAFYGCSELKSVEIAEGLTSIGELAFNNCSSLVSIKIPASVTSWDYAFCVGCSSLSNVTLSDGLTSIGVSAFANCGSLTNITVPASVTSINDYAFENDDLKAIDFEGAPPTFGSFVGINQDAAIRYNVSYQDKWLEKIAMAGWTNARPYAPGASDLTENEIRDWVAIDLGTKFAKPGETAEQYQKRFEAKFGTDYRAALVKRTGKINQSDINLCVWHDYVAGTDPLDLTSQLKASIQLDGGVPVVKWSPALNGEGVKDGVRLYKVFGVRALEDDWTEVNGDEVLYNFFKVTVEMP